MCLDSPSLSAHADLTQSVKYQHYIPLNGNSMIYAPRPLYMDIIALPQAFAVSDNAMINILTHSCMHICGITCSIGIAGTKDTYVVNFNDIAQVLHVGDKEGAALQENLTSAAYCQPLNAGSFLLPENVDP